MIFVSTFLLRVCGERFALNIPSNLLILPLPRLHLQTHLIHLMHIPSSPHITQNILLQLRHGLQRVRHILVLLDVADDFGGLCAFGKIDQVGLFDDIWDAFFDEGEIREVDT
jgi:hypothetical protein